MRDRRDPNRTADGLTPGKVYSLRALHRALKPPDSKSAYSRSFLADEVRAGRLRGEERGNGIFVLGADALTWIARRRRPRDRQGP